MPLSAHEFERRLIFYASPTLTKLKVACIYNLNDLDDLEECIQYYNELLNKKDIYLKVLKIKGRSMIYVYQKEKLNKILSQNTNQPLNKIIIDTDRDYFLEPDEALKYGLIDEII